MEKKDKINEEQKAEWYQNFLKASGLQLLADHHHSCTSDNLPNLSCASGEQFEPTPHLTTL